MRSSLSSLTIAISPVTFCRPCAAMRPNSAKCHADKTWRQTRKEGQDLAATKPFAHHDPVRFINAMRLKDVLGQIQPNRCNLRHRWLPFLVIFDDHHSGTQMP
jgi:hypothetical protein